MSHTKYSHFTTLYTGYLKGLCKWLLRDPRVPGLRLHFRLPSAMTPIGSASAMKDGPSSTHRNPIVHRTPYQTHYHTSNTTLPNRHVRVEHPHFILHPRHNEPLGPWRSRRALPGGAAPRIQHTLKPHRAHGNMCPRHAASARKTLAHTGVSADGARRGVVVAKMNKTGTLGFIYMSAVF
jgi:hypothetical protein